MCRSDQPTHLAEATATRSPLAEGGSGIDQIEFVNLVIDELSDSGVIEPRRFYESPFTDVSPEGPDALFESADVDRLLEVLADVRRRAEAA